MLILPCGAAVIEGDTHISAWVAKQNKLTIAEKYLSPFRKFVPVGGTVVDVGAMIGDHTMTYADWVGPGGKVHAFEPNPEAFECLAYNMRDLDQVVAYKFGLSDQAGTCKLNLSPNAGASHLSNEEGEIKMIALDDLDLASLHFLKIDAEGFETRILSGARETLHHLCPAMLIEVNEGALVRAGSCRDELLGLIHLMGYDFTITDPKLKFTDAQYDVICTKQDSLA